MKFPQRAILSMVSRIGNIFRRIPNYCDPVFIVIRPLVSTCPHPPHRSKKAPPFLIRASQSSRECNSARPTPPSGRTPRLHPGNRLAPPLHLLPSRNTKNSPRSASRGNPSAAISRQQLAPCNALLSDHAANMRPHRRSPPSPPPAPPDGHRKRIPPMRAQYPSSSAGPKPYPTRSPANPMPPSKTFRSTTTLAPCRT